RGICSWLACALALSSRRAPGLLAYVAAAIPDHLRRHGTGLSRIVANARGESDRTMATGRETARATSVPPRIGVVRVSSDAKQPAGSTPTAWQADARCPRSTSPWAIPKARRGSREAGL